MKLRFLHFLAGLACLWPAAFSQNPIRFSGGTEVDTGIGPYSELVFAADVVGTAHEETILAEDDFVSIVDRHAPGGPTSYTGIIPNGGNCKWLESADMNGDGIDDLVIQGFDFFSPQVVVMLSTGGTVLSDGTIFTATAYSFASGLKAHVADLDADGDIDVVCGAEYRLNAGNGTLGPTIPLVVGGAALTDVLPGDVDGDGDMDLISVYYGNASTGFGVVARVIRRNSNGTYTLTATKLLAHGPGSVWTAVGDLNADGRADLVYLVNFLNAQPGINGESQGLEVGYWAGGVNGLLSPFSAIPFWASSGTRRISLVDLDGNGRKDILFGSLVTSEAIDPFESGQNHGVAVAVMTRADGQLTSPDGRATTALRRLDAIGIVDVYPIDDDLDGRPELLTREEGVWPRLHQNMSATAAIVAAGLYESVGPDLLLSSATYRHLSLTLIDTFDQASLAGQFLTLTVSLPSGETHTSTQVVSDRSRFRLPASFQNQTFSATVSASNGLAQTFTVHPTAVIASVTGGGQTTDPMSPFAQPVVVTVTDPSGTPLVGLRVDLFLSGGAPVFSFTDTLGRATLNVSAGATVGTQNALISVAGGVILSNVSMTVSPSVVTIDSGGGQSTCVGQSFAQPIVGRVLTSGGSPIGGATVAISSNSPAVTFTPSTTQTAADGSFMFQGFGASVGVAQFTVAHLGANSQASGAPLAVVGNGISILAGQGQVATNGQTLALPLTVLVTNPCASPAGLVVNFATTTANITVISPTATVAADGTASTTIVTQGVGSASVVASIGAQSVTFNFFTRRLSSIRTPTALIIVYNHERASVPLVLGVDLPGTPPLTTPWGTIATSILAPAPSFAVLDGLGLFGSIDPGMTTNVGGSWSRLFSIPPSLTGLGTFVAQMYGYDGNAIFPYDYIVSNPVNFTL